MFHYPLRIEIVSPRHLWIRNPSGEPFAIAEGGTPREPGIIRVRRSGDGRPADEILRVVDTASERGMPLGTPDGGKNLPSERLSAERLKRWYSGPGVPGEDARPFHYRVLDPDASLLGLLRVESSWRGTWEIADASWAVVGRLVREGMFSRDSNVEFAGRVAMRLRRRSLLFGGMELSEAEPVTLSDEQEKLTLACVATMLLAGSSGEG
jgi:hypothetical protein